MSSTSTAGAGPSTSLQTHPHAPISTSIPISAVQSLIPRLTTTINDIDSLKAQIASGNGDASLPSWDTLLQRYSLLLGRINSISSFLSPSPSASTSASAGAGGGRTNFTSGAGAGADLRRYLVHPLHPLPTSSGPSGDIEEISPLAPETFFQVINTLPNPLTLSKTKSASNSSEVGREWHSSEELRKMSESSLSSLERSLRQRLERDSRRANALKEEVERQSEEYDWKLRIDEDDDQDQEEEEEEQEEGGKVKEGKEQVEQVEQVDKEEDDDLFGGDDDDDDVVMLDSRPTAAAPTEPLQPVLEHQSNNPKATWTLNDYVRYMDTGEEPTPSSTT